MFVCFGLWWMWRATEILPTRNRTEIRFICCAFNSLGTLHIPPTTIFSFCALPVLRLHIDSSRHISILIARAPLDNNNFHLCKINVMNKAQAIACLSLSLLICTFSKLIIHKRVHDVCRHRRPKTENAGKKKTKNRFQLWISFACKWDASSFRFRRYRPPHPSLATRHQPKNRF